MWFEFGSRPAIRRNRRPKKHRCLCAPTSTRCVVTCNSISSAYRLNPFADAHPPHLRPHLCPHLCPRLRPLPVINPTVHSTGIRSTHTPSRMVSINTRYAQQSQHGLPGSFPVFVVSDRRMCQEKTNSSNRKFFQAFLCRTSCERYTNRIFHSSFWRPALPDTHSNDHFFFLVLLRFCITLYCKRQVCSFHVVCFSSFAFFSFLLFWLWPLKIVLQKTRSFYRVKGAIRNLCWSITFIFYNQFSKQQKRIQSGKLQKFIGNIWNYIEFA